MTQSKINALTEKRMLKLFDQGKIDDDMVQRWYDNKEYEQDIYQDALAEFGIK